MYGEALSHLQHGQIEKAQSLFQSILQDPISIKAQVRLRCRVLQIDLVCFLICVGEKLYVRAREKKFNHVTFQFVLAGRTGVECQYHASIAVSDFSELEQAVGKSSSPLLTGIWNFETPIVV